MKCCFAFFATSSSLRAFESSEFSSSFFTTRPPGEGTGLGLAAVRRFVHAQGGRVEVESEIGKGSTFRLVFPLASERAGRATG